MTGRYPIDESLAFSLATSVEQLHVSAVERWLRLDLLSQKADLFRLILSTSEHPLYVLATWKRQVPHSLFLPPNVSAVDEARFTRQVSFLVDVLLREQCAGQDYDELTTKEIEVLSLLLGGKTDKEIATSQQISTRTVRYHITNLFRKFKVTGRTELVSKILANVKTVPIDPQAEARST